MWHFSLRNNTICRTSPPPAINNTICHSFASSQSVNYKIIQNLLFFSLYLLFIETCILFYWELYYLNHNFFLCLNIKYSNSFLLFVVLERYCYPCIALYNYPLLLSSTIATEESRFSKHLLHFSFTATFLVSQYPLLTLLK